MSKPQVYESQLPKDLNPPFPGWVRSWVQCRKCSKVYAYDYLPYSLSYPILAMPCGHDLKYDMVEVEVIPDPKPMRYVANAFNYWTDGRNEHDGNEHDVFVGDPDGQPYVVRAIEPGVIRLNVLIFAASEADAVERIKQGLRIVHEKHYRNYVKSRASQMLERLEAGDFDVQPLDKRYTLKVAWAFNDRVV